MATTYGKLIAYEMCNASH